MGSVGGYFKNILFNVEFWNVAWAANSMIALNGTNTRLDTASRCIKYSCETFTRKTGKLSRDDAIVVSFRWQKAL